MIPQMNRFSYDTAEGLQVTWDLGLSAAATKTRSKAKVTFWIYSSAAKWGFRAAAEKYYGLNPASFTSNSSVEGSWTLASEAALRKVPNSQDFGWGFLEPSNMGKLGRFEGAGDAALHRSVRVVPGLPGVRGIDNASSLQRADQRSSQRRGDRDED